MAITILIPTPLRPSVEGNQKLTYEKKDTVINILLDLTKKYPKLKQYLFNPTGNLQKFVNFYKNDIDIRDLDNELTLLEDTDTLSIIPAIAGG